MAPPRAHFLLLSASLLAAAADTQTIRVQWERGTDFSKYQTFAWIDGQSADPDVDPLIRHTVGDQLSGNGIFPDEQDPDLHVAYYASAQEEVQITGGYSANWKEADAIMVSRFVAGTLVIDLVDASENRILWRAIATSTVTGDLQKSRSLIPRIIQKMFTDFPPQK